MTLRIYFTSAQYRLGLVAWLATLAVVAIALLRQRPPFGYEAWRASHILLGLAAVGFGAAHAIEVGDYAEATGLSTFWIAAAAVAGASVALAYLWRTVAIRVDGWRLVRNEAVGRGLWRLAFRRESGKPFRFRAGQFVWLTTAPRLFPLFDHPFSIASSPREAEVSFVIKEAGDYTSRIGTLAPGTRAGLDGPHGAFAREDHPADALLLIAGGAGIAPILGLARDLDLADDPRPVRVLVAAGGPDRLVGLDDLAAIAARRDLVVHTIVEAGGPGYEGALGRLDRAALERLLSGPDPARTLAMICGPGPFMVAATDGLLDLGLPEDNVLYERFDYADGTLSRLDRAERRRVRLVGLALALGVAAFALR
jgi:predicted ferric reductase